MKEEQSLPLGMAIQRMNSELYRVFRKRIREQAEIKLTVFEYGLLSFIGQSNDVIQKNMAEAMGKDQSAVLKLIDSLEKKKLIKRIVGVNDRRKNYLTITGKGEKVLGQYQKIEFELIDELQQGIPESDLTSFYKIANLITAKAEKL